MIKIFSFLLHRLQFLFQFYFPAIKHMACTPSKMWWRRGRCFRKKSVGDVLKTLIGGGEACVIEGRVILLKIYGIKDLWQIKS